MTQAYFEYNGRKSTEFGLRIENKISFTSPEADIEFVEVLGKDGDVAIDHGRLKGFNFPIAVRLYAPQDKTVDEVATEISNWLKSDIGWKPFYFSGSPDYEYEALMYQAFDIQENLKRNGSAVITFRMKPYKVLRGQKVKTLTNGETLTNEGFRPSKPLLRIDGSGDITLQNNGQDWVKLVDVVNYIIIDSEAMLVYREINNAQNKKFNSTLEPMFPILDTGENTITWTGNVDSVQIETRWGSIS